MRWANFFKFSLISIAILALFAFCIQPLAFSIKQGLDLQGGTHIVLQAIDTPETKVDEDAMQRVQKIIEMRVNELGLTEPLIQREQGTHRLIVELPGIKDPEKAIDMIGKTGYLAFRDEAGNTVLTGKDLKDAKASIDQTNRNMVNIEFTQEGAKAFAKLTAENVGKHIAIVLDDQVLTNPVVQEAIPSGKAEISGSRTIEEAQRLAILLRSGALPVKVELLETRTVGPTLGEDSKEKSQKAFAIGIAMIVIFMLCFYRLSGMVANITLCLYVLALLFVLKMLNATLTLPGIAGIILSMGMAVDANVLIFERFKEEYRNGKTLRAAMDSGFNRALSTIIDANMTTLIAAVVLFLLGSSQLRGFAITLGIGILLSMFTAITVTKYMLRLFISSNITKNGKIYGA